MIAMVVGAVVLMFATLNVFRRLRGLLVLILISFFLSIALFVALAQRAGGAHWLLAAAVLLGAAAIVRTLAAMLGHAAFAPQFIVPEVVMAAILLVAARLRGDERQIS